MTVRANTLFRRMRRFLVLAALGAVMVLPLSAALIASTAQARPLLPSDLPPDLRAREFGADAARVHEQSGEASWYGPRHHGKRTASGARFDQRGLTAAHRSFPLGSKIRVVREDNGRSVIVTVNDRLSDNGRIIDLSRGAAERLGMVREGTTQVMLMPFEETEVALAPEPKKKPR